VKKIAIIIRGKHNIGHEPELLNQHADVVLSDGSPMGYFGSEGYSPSVGMFMRGLVINYHEFSAINREAYVDARVAKQQRVVSTICYFPVAPQQAKKFDQWWKSNDNLADGRNSNFSFSLLGNNCSSHANKALKHANIISGSIPGLDSPQNLFLQLKSKFGSSFKCQSGYIGFRPVGQKFQLEVIK
jgi:hypothetical protein